MKTKGLGKFWENFSAKHLVFRILQLELGNQGFTYSRDLILDSY